MIAYDTIRGQWETPQDRKLQALKRGLAWNENDPMARCSLFTAFVTVNSEMYLSDLEMQHALNPDDLRKRVEHVVKLHLLRKVYAPIYERHGRLMRMQREIMVSIDRAMMMPKLNEIFAPLTEIIEITSGTRLSSHPSPKEKQE